MNLTINGQAEALEREEISVVELLKVKEVKMPEMVAVQLNGKILARDEFASTLVHENDQVEFLYFMGGGAAGNL